MLENYRKRCYYQKLEKYAQLKTTIMDGHIDIIRLQRRTIFILAAALLIILGWIILSNDLIRKTAIRLNSSIEKTLSYQDYKDICLIEKIYPEDYYCKEVKTLILLTLEQYNRMIWGKSDYNCSDFENNWHFAQGFFDYTNGKKIDWYGLDEDRDGVACEELLKERL